MKIKICGITSKDEIEALNKYKPDYVGFVFAESKRKVTKEVAKTLCEALDKDIKKVGVFRNNSVSYIQEVLELVDLDIVQLHGDEDIEYIKKIKEKIEVWKGVSVKSKKDVEEAIKLPVDELILDGSNPGEGKTFDWKYIEGIPENIKIFIAGGINSDNVLEAINNIHVKGIDVSSGVESVTNGIRRKDPIKIERIIEKVR